MAQLCILAVGSLMRLCCNNQWASLGLEKPLSRFTDIVGILVLAWPRVSAPVGIDLPAR